MDNIFTGIFFSSIGLGYFMYGKKISDMTFMIFGAALMGYTYAVSDFFYSIVTGIVLMIIPFLLQWLKEG